LNISPLDKKICLNKGAILLGLKKYQEALECFDYIITKIDPLFIEAYINKGLTLKRLERYDEALKVYDEASKIDKNNFKILINK
jgi:tetratricopeptide (TPR) repeat protein